MLEADVGKLSLVVRLKMASVCSSTQSLQLARHGISRQDLKTGSAKREFSASSSRYIRCWALSNSLNPFQDPL